LLLVAGATAMLNARNWHRSYFPASIGQNPFVIRSGNELERWDIGLARKIDDTEALRGARILVFDLPGYLAYRTHSEIVPTDGLINHYGYSDDIRREGIASWLRQKNIDYYLGPLGLSYTGFMDKGDPAFPRPPEVPDLSLIGPDGLQPVTVYAPLTNQIAGQIVIYAAHPVVSVEADRNRTIGVFRIVPTSR